MKKNGFTLLELIIAIAVLAVLIAFVLAILDPFSQFQKGRDARRKSDLGQIQKALEQYYQDHQQYPPSSGSDGTHSYEIVDTSTNPMTPLDWGNTTPVWQKYIEIIPKDPDASKKYIYLTDPINCTMALQTSCQSYWLYAALDRGTKDPDVCTGGTCQGYTQGIPACGSATCDYGVSSPNTNP